MNRMYSIVVVTAVFWLSAVVPAAQIAMIEKLPVAGVWAGHPVNFALKTVNNFQCVAYYDTTRKMVVASRRVEDTVWNYTTLSTSTGWDSHNYIELAVDDSGYVHVSGNMHNVKLVYFRSVKPWNTVAFEAPGMVGTLENSVTYPVFISGPGNQLYFQYRDGGSGSGTTIWNRYRTQTKRWSRITLSGFLDGEGQVSPYHVPPVAGPDGFFHIIWMWRETPVANTNFHLSHMKSIDLVAWQTMAGTPLVLPVKQSTPGVVVDPIASGKGLINMDYWISWDREQRPVVTYHRYDNKSISQIFNTRYEFNSWKIYQTSSWTGFTWDLDRQGSLTHDIAATPLTVDETGELVQDYVYRTSEVRRWVLDEATLKPESDGVYVPPAAMKELYVVESNVKGMQVNIIRDGEYCLRWESMPINQDVARDAGTYPSSSPLRLYRFSPVTAVVNEYGHPAPLTGFNVENTPRQVCITRSSTPGASGPLSVSLFSLEGRCVAQKKWYDKGACTLPLEHLSSGLYMLRVVPEGGGPENKLHEWIGRTIIRR